MNCLLIERLLFIYFTKHSKSFTLKIKHVINF